MARNVVAVLDIRSANITAVIGERGVNDTFVFKGLYTERYQGYENGAFIDEDHLSRVVSKAFSKALQNCKEKITAVYVGVPSAFLKVSLKDNFLGFSSRRKISLIEIEELFENNYNPNEIEDYSLIKACASYFTLSDKRRCVNPEGLLSSSLAGRISYIHCSNYFIDCLKGVLEGICSYPVKFIPSIYAQMVYLIPQEVRKCGAAYIDFGLCSTDVAVIYGNGLISVKSFPIGESLIMEKLYDKYGLDDYATAEEVTSKLNLFIKRSPAGNDKIMPLLNEELSIPYYEANEEATIALDELGEAVYSYLDEYDQKFPSGNLAVYASGDGVLRIRGALELFTDRFNKVIEEAKPKLPYYNKTSVSSAISVLNMAQSDVRKNSNGIIFKFIKKFGG